MVPDNNALNDFFKSDLNPLENCNKNTLLIDCSTIGPKNALEHYNKLKQQGFNFIDAPVSGIIKRWNSWSLKGYIIIYGWLRK